MQQKKRSIVFWRPKYFDAQILEIRWKNKFDKNKQTRRFLKKIIINNKKLMTNILPSSLIDSNVNPRWTHRKNEELR
jgi:hypothetical protein